MHDEDNRRQHRTGTENEENAERENVVYPLYGSHILDHGLRKNVASMGDGRYIIYYSWEEESY